MVDATAGEVLGEPEGVASAFRAALGRRGAGIAAHLTLHELLRRSRLYDDLVDALASPEPATRAAAARICGAARITESVAWLGDLVDDPDSRVRDAAVRSLAYHGGRRAVEHLMASAEKIPTYRLAIALSKAASDIDLEMLLRRPASAQAALAIVLACGLRRDRLRVGPLLAIAHDQRWPKLVRVAACKALAAVGDRSALHGLNHLAQSDAEPRVKGAAERAHRRLVRRAVRR